MDHNLKLRLSSNLAHKEKFRIELLGMVNRRASFHRSADALRVRIGRVVRDAIYLHGSTRLSFPDLSPVAGSRLSLGAAILAGPLRLKATLEGDFGTVELIDTEIDANDTWTDLNVAIPKEVTAPFRLIPHRKWQAFLKQL